MTQTLTTCAQKGGTGKTSVALNLAAAFHGAQRRVLIVDTDPQANASTQLGVVIGRGEPGVGECLERVMLGEDPDTSGAIRHTVSGIDVLGANGNLEAVRTRMATELNRLWFMRSVLDPVRAHYDIVIIDTPPSLGELPQAAMAAAPAVKVLGISNGEPMSIPALVTMRRLVAQVGQAMVGEPGPVWMGTVVNKLDSRRGIVRESVDMLAGQGLEPFTTTIPNHVEVVNASATDMPALLTYPSAAVSEKFMDLTVEVMERVAAAESSQEAV